MNILEGEYARTKRLHEAEMRRMAKLTLIPLVIAIAVLAALRSFL